MQKRRSLVRFQANTLKSRRARVEIMYTIEYKTVFVEEVPTVSGFLGKCQVEENVVDVVSSYV
uniref:Uncharacterized protein n=1 Tax=Kalanchoe fedtschenkoi TaxID=63787 RepID=A0A7N0UME9_KALFE